MMKKHGPSVTTKIRQSIAQLLSGQRLEDKELLHLNHWYDNFNDDNWNTVDKKLKEAIQQKMYTHIHREIDRSGESNKAGNLSNYPDRSLHGFPPPTVSFWVRAAVISFLVISTALGLWVSKFSSEPDVPLQQEWATFQNPKGQKSKLKLPDGSQMVLNAASKVRFHKEFGKSHRDIFLIGEAYFEVAKNSVPFRVYNNGLVTEALGTAFNIHAFDENQVRVQLTSGQVKVYQVQEPQENILLLPGEMVRMSEGKLSAKESFDIERALAWKNGTIWFKKTPFDDVLIQLERWYAVQINVEDSSPAPKDLYISGIFHEAMLSHLLESLAYSYRFEYEINQKEVTIKFKPPLPM